MTKFQFNYQDQTLAYQKHDLWYELSEDNLRGKFNSLWFNLANGWINFTIYANRIRAFAKQISYNQDLTDFCEPQSIKYFSRDLPKECPVIFTFTEKDEVAKIGNKWVKKNQVLSETKGGKHER